MDRHMYASDQRQMLDALMEYAVAGIAIADSKTGSLLAMSRHGLALLGVEGIDLADVPLQQIIDMRMFWHPDGSAPIRLAELPLYRAALGGEEVLNEEWLIRRPDGWEIPVLCNAGPIRDTGGGITGGIVTFEDISDLKAAQHALETAYNRERHISDVLQQALMPSVPVDTPGCEVATEYHPALTESEIGGDFYDVFSVGEGWLALVMGDVAGKGLRAAVCTSMAKYMIRAYAHEDPEPRSVLRRLNETLSEFISDDMFITIFFGLYDTDRRVLAYANAGHEPPLLYGPGFGATIELDVTGPAIGVLSGSTYAQRAAQLSEDNILVIYTDGITDSRRGTAFFGADGLTEVVAQYADCSARIIASGIYQATMKHSHGQLSDDAALLVLKPRIIERESERLKVESGMLKVESLEGNS